MKESGRSPKQQSFYMLFVVLNRLGIGTAYGMMFSVEGESRLFKPSKDYGW